jgi:hypothetical protein
MEAEEVRNEPEEVPQDDETDARMEDIGRRGVVHRKDESCKVVLMWRRTHVVASMGQQGRRMLSRAHIVVASANDLVLSARAGGCKVVLGLSAAAHSLRVVEMGPRSHLTWLDLFALVRDSHIPALDVPVLDVPGLDVPGLDVPAPTCIVALHMVWLAQVAAPGCILLLSGHNRR